MIRPPGPGAYSPPDRGAVSDRSTSRSPTAAFKSQTARMREPPIIGRVKDAGDPGAYDPNTFREISSEVSLKSSFNRSNNAGVANFGSTSDRTLPLAILGEGTPGPSDYNPKMPQAYDGCKANSSIRSHSPQRLPTRGTDIPGVGAYDPPTTLTMGSTTTTSHFSGKMSEMGRESRYAGDYAQAHIGSETETGVGPGTFYPDIAQVDRSIGHDLATTLDHVGHVTDHGFGVKARAHDLPFEHELRHDQNGSPGPGAYETAVDHHAIGDGHRSSFATLTKRGVNRIEEGMGDPGAYEPNAYNELAVSASASFSRSHNAGVANFGSSSERALPLEILGGGDTPGPSDYNPKMPQAYDGCKANSSIRSHSPQRLPTRGTDIPGVGAYDPPTTLTMGSTTTTSHFSGKMSEMGRESRYAGDYAQAHIGSETESGVGPGTFYPQLTNTGHRNTMEGVAREHKEVHGWGWHIVSDSVRNVFQFMLPEEVGTSR